MGFGWSGHSWVLLHECITGNRLFKAGNVMGDLSIRIEQHAMQRAADIWLRFASAAGWRMQAAGWLPCIRTHQSSRAARVEKDLVKGSE